ncbi:16S rRNA (guanine(527)-N(7))-methyltransferase RsmG [Corynebacterium jeikeium]|uniref:16S rRNA (guanine(527)-N(7))-methyltransferase RsmG n=1 Tax=Corynebacterium jeikeium TaxID=38289 RepID=UPI000885262D|nr:16S rRNA (guanine(527)-N(7))-methyltransferase RsmG [Corynebacterium jeikeium]SCX25759.1 Ribosomal RNA small subunit methyltransferase G [Corynebacterium jeikeium]
MAKQDDASIQSPDIGEPPAAAREVFGNRLPLACDYAEFLATAGIERGLLGPREVPRIWERHILNSAVLGEVIDEGCRVVDIGSGAGLPGIPLAIARPDLKVQLLEPLLRRYNFLAEINDRLNLGCEVVRGRAEDPAVVDALGGADVATSRAVAPLGKLTRWSLPLVKVGGAMKALKGGSVAEELERDAKEIAKAGGGDGTIELVGESKVAEPTHVITIPRTR